MKHTSIAAYEQIKGKMPGLLYQTMAMLDYRPGTASETHERIAKMRPNTAYSSVRSRFWELEIMGAIVPVAEQKVIYENGKSQTHLRYALTQLGKDFMGIDPVDAVNCLKKCASEINKGRERRTARCLPIVAQENSRMGARACQHLTRAVANV